MKIERFEDIEAWKEARKFVNMIYDLMDKPAFKKDYDLKCQIKDAATSVMSNIAEGFDRGTNKEFIQFLVIARGSTSEVKSRLYVALDRRYIDENEFKLSYQQGTTVINLINGFIRYLNTSTRKK